MSTVGIEPLCWAKYPWSPHARRLLTGAKIGSKGLFFLFSCRYFKLPVVRQTTRSLRSYENVLCVKLSALQLFHVGHFYKIGEVSVLSLYWHDWFSCGEEENERSSSIKYENFTSLFGRPWQKLPPESVPHVQHDYVSSLNQSYYWFVTLSSLYVTVVVGRVRKSKCVSRAACSLE